MKYIKCWPLPLLLCTLLLAGYPAVVVGDAGSDYLASKEQEVEQIANQSLANYNQRCELLATCNNGPTNCSHDACEPLLGDRDGLTCMVVNKNKYCSVHGTSNTSCNNLNLDYRRSYVRKAQTTNLESVDTMLSICSQRLLDPLMVDFAVKTRPVLTRHFFAPLDGTWRAVPGNARFGDDCGTKSMEPRGRPWFRTATSITKVVVVLIDLAASMNYNLPPEFGAAGTLLAAAKNIATELLITLSTGDYVNIIVFNSTRATPLAPSAIQVQDHTINTEQVELDPLKLQLNNLTVETQLKQSDLSGAILAALPNFDSNTHAAKVILVITDGAFATLGDVTLPSANLTSVKLFLYKLKRPDDPDTFLSNNSLTRQICAVGGHFEPILKNLDNPLLALHKFFSYLANLKRTLTGGGPQYSFVYPDFEQIGGNITVVSKPVFFGDDLIGVAGVTIYIELLSSLTDAVNQALQSKITGLTFLTAPVVLTAENCSIVNETTNPCGGNVYNVINGGLCMKTDMTSSIQDITCCGVCSAPNNSHLLGSKVIAGIAVAGSLGLVGLAIVGGFGRRSYRRRKEEIARAAKLIDRFPGDLSGVVKD